jgi:hypothetical protein
MTCKTCRHAWYNQALRSWHCDKRGGTRLPGLTGCKKWEAKQ